MVLRLRMRIKNSSVFLIIYVKIFVPFSTKNAKIFCIGIKEFFNKCYLIGLKILDK